MGQLDSAGDSQFSMATQLIQQRQEKSAMASISTAERMLGHAERVAPRAKRRATAISLVF